MTDTVLYEMEGAVAVITLNRPEKRNVLNTATRDGVLAAWQRFEADPAARAAILTAAGVRTGLYTSPHLVRVTERQLQHCGEALPDAGLSNAHQADKRDRTGTKIGG